MTQIKFVMVSIINMAPKNDSNYLQHGFNKQHGKKLTQIKFIMVSIINMAPENDPNYLQHGVQ